MLEKLDIYISKYINKITVGSKSLTFFLKIVTHTSGGRIYPIYAFIIPFIMPNGFLISKIGIIGFAFQVPFYILIKNAIKRRRPSHEDGISQIIVPPDKYSFPSGHCASSILFALIINQYFPSIAIYFLIWMVVIFISRIGLGIHYFSDVLGGAFLGLLSFYIAIQLSTYFI